MEEDNSTRNSGMKLSANQRRRVPDIRWIMKRVIMIMRIMTKLWEHQW